MYVTTEQLKRLKRILIVLGIYVFVQYAVWYIFSPPINIKSFEFWCCFGIPLAIALLFTIPNMDSLYAEIVLITLFGLLCFCVINSLGSYDKDNYNPNEIRAQIAQIQEDGNISNAVPVISSVSEFPIIDKEKAISLGNQIINSFCLAS